MAAVEEEKDLAEAGAVDPEAVGDGEGEGDSEPTGESTETVKKSKAQQTYEDVKAYIDQGDTKAEAFEKVAKDSSRSVATITTAYYRWARANEPDQIRSQAPRGGGTGSAPAAASGSASAAKGKSAPRAVQGGVASQLKATLKEIGKLHAQLDRLAENVVQMEKDAKGIADARKALGIK